MKFEIDWGEASTWRGLMWLLGGVVGLTMLWYDKDPTPITPFLATLTGAMGLTTKDRARTRRAGDQR